MSILLNQMLKNVDQKFKAGEADEVFLFLNGRKKLVLDPCSRKRYDCEECLHQEPDPYDGSPCSKCTDGSLFKRLVL